MIRNGSYPDAEGPGSCSPGGLQGAEVRAMQEAGTGEDEEEIPGHRYLLGVQGSSPEGSSLYPHQPQQAQTHQTHRSPHRSSTSLYRSGRH